MLSKNLKAIRCANGHLKRYFSAQAQTKSQSSSLQVSTIPSGVTLASLESESPIARLAVIVRAGSRYEPQNKLGLSHIVRSSAGLATKRFTSFGITRNIEYHGGKLSVIGTRDSITYLLEVHNEDEIVPQHFTMLTDTIANPAFKPWEIEDNVDRIKADLSLMDDTPFIQLTEMIHQVAFKGGLRNSLYTPKFMIGKLSQNDLKEYHKKTFVAANTAVVSLGVDHQHLTDLVAKNLILPSTSSEKDSSKFIGGEFHADSCSPLTYVAIACEGASINKSTKDYLAAALLQKILGAGSQIKCSINLNQVQRLGRAISAHMSGKSTEGISVSAFNYNYENSGLFGINLVSPNSNDVPALVKAAVKEFRATCNSISDAELKDAK